MAENYVEGRWEPQKASKHVFMKPLGLLGPILTSCRLLDGFLLLAAGGSNTPDEAAVDPVSSPNSPDSQVVTVNLSSLQIVDIAEEDSKSLHFKHILHLMFIKCIYICTSNS